MTLPQHDEGLRPRDIDGDGTTDDETGSLFDESENSTDDTEVTEILSSNSDSDTEDEAYLSEDERPRPPRILPRRNS